MIYCFVYLRQQQVKIQIRAWSGIRVLARAADRLEPTCLLLEGHTERDRSPYETRRPVLLTFLSTLKFIDESISDVFNRKEVCLSARVGYGCREAVRLSLRTARRSVQTHRTILAREKKKKNTPQNRRIPNAWVTVTRFGNGVSPVSECSRGNVSVLYILSGELNTNLCLRRKTLSSAWNWTSCGLTPIYPATHRSWVNN